MIGRGVSPRGARSFRRIGSLRRAGATALAAASVLTATACSSADDRIVDRTWQVTGVFDDPALPTAPVEDQVPPIIVFGANGYTGSSACGEYRGDVDWLGDGIVRLGEPRPLRQRDCPTPAAEYDRRLAAILPGDQRIAVDGDGLRSSRVEDHPAGTAARGFAAVQVGATADR